MTGEDADALDHRQLFGSTPCVLGSTLSDSRCWSGTARNPNNDGVGGDTGLYKSINGTTKPAAGGTITWALYGPDNCTTAVTLNATSATVSGQRAPIPRPRRRATSASRQRRSARTRSSPPTRETRRTRTAWRRRPVRVPVNGTEHIVVSGNASTVSAQRWLPNDRIVVSGDANLNGTLTVTLYPSSNCTGTAVPNQSYSTTFARTQRVLRCSTRATRTFFVGTQKSDGTAGGTAGAYSWNKVFD